MINHRKSCKCIRLNGLITIAPDALMTIQMWYPRICRNNAWVAICFLIQRDPAAKPKSLRSSDFHWCEWTPQCAGPFQITTFQNHHLHQWDLKISFSEFLSECRSLFWRGVCKDDFRMDDGDCIVRMVLLWVNFMVLVFFSMPQISCPVPAWIPWLLHGIMSTSSKRSWIIAKGILLRSFCCRKERGKNVKGRFVRIDVC